MSMATGHIRSLVISSDFSFLLLSPLHPLLPLGSLSIYDRAYCLLATSSSGKRTLLFAVMVAGATGSWLLAEVCC